MKTECKTRKAYIEKCTRNLSPKSTKDNVCRIEAKSLVNSTVCRKCMHVHVNCSYTQMYRTHLNHIASQ